MTFVYMNTTQLTTNLLILCLGEIVLIVHSPVCEGYETGERGGEGLRRQQCCTTVRQRSGWCRQGEAPQQRF